jgi:hypothetical protein
MASENKFRNSVTNNRYLNGLFFEQTGADKSTVMYTLKDTDHSGYPSLYRLYMETDDPTEWEFSQRYLDGWEHWEMLTRCAWFKPFIERWRKELELRMKSKSLAKIKAEAKTGSKESFMANKYLLEKGWEPKETKGRGRPSKDEINKAAEEIAKVDGQLSADFERIVGRPQ